MSERLAAAEWRRSRESFDSARLCQSNALYADAISRSYYAVMHAAKAVLEFREISVHSHNGVRNCFGRYIVNPGLVEQEWSDTIRTLGELRIDADYYVLRSFTEAETASACGLVEAFLNRIRPLLPADIAAAP